MSAQLLLILLKHANLNNNIWFCNNITMQQCVCIALNLSLNIKTSIINRLCKKNKKKTTNHILLPLHIGSLVNVTTHLPSQHTWHWSWPEQVFWSGLTFFLLFIPSVNNTLALARYHIISHSCSSRREILSKKTTAGTRERWVKSHADLGSYLQMSLMQFQRHKREFLNFSYINSIYAKTLFNNDLL